MNKTAIKNFAIWARNKLIADISYKAGLLGITDKEIHKPTQVAQGVEFYSVDKSGARQFEVKGKEIEQRRHLADKITEKAKQSDYGTAYKAVIEEVAYTWFNRLIAVRFMEVNDYLPSRIRVLSSTTGKNEPDIVTTPFDTDLDFSQSEREYIFACKSDNKLDELFRMLFIKQCNALNVLLPELFERIGDYTELLLNISFTDKDGVVWHLINDITEVDFKEAVEIIGWIYQYYNTEPKDETFALLKKNVKITKERIPAATQLFTPHWIVRYMVENSLGRLWVERQNVLIPTSDYDEEPGVVIENLLHGCKYYLHEARQEQEVHEQIVAFRKMFPIGSPEEIKVFDPCMGSGHILVYAFDVLIQIYRTAGYADRDAAKLILEKNLYGLDIDKRAYQLAYFALLMKARQYNRRILNGEIKPQVYHPTGFADIEEYGSLLKVDDPGAASELIAGQQDLFNNEWNFRRLLSMKYDVVVTNPPYMGGSGMSGTLSKFVKDNYPDSKSDLFAAFIERCGALTKANGYTAMITQHAWMFLSSYEKLRVKLRQRDTVNMVHLGARAFAEIGGEVVQCTAFVMRNSNIPDYKGGYVRLVDIGDADGKEREFLSGNHRYAASADSFAKIPGSPVAYWVSASAYASFESQSIGDVAVLCQGLTTTDNEKYVRYWFEPVHKDIGVHYATTDEAKSSLKRWFPFNKGGSFRKWFGNRELVVDYENDGYAIKADVLRKYPYLKTPDFVVKNSQYYFNQGLTWSALSNAFSIRWSDSGSICADKGQGLFAPENELYIYCGLLNSKVASLFLGMISPTLDFNCGYVRRVPFIPNRTINDRVTLLVSQNVALSRADWDSFETSWDFKRHPLV